MKWWSRLVTHAKRCFICVAWLRVALHCRDAAALDAKHFIKHTFDIKRAIKAYDNNDPRNLIKIQSSHIDLWILVNNAYAKRSRTGITCMQIMPYPTTNTSLRTPSSRRRPQ